MKLRQLIPFCLALITLAGTVHAQHVWWDTKAQSDGKCVYGEITVLTTYPCTYYCGINWHAGQPAGGYCGIQDNSYKQRCTIFSIWDTSPQLHPVVTEADPETNVRRFGGEGTGGHTDMPTWWNVGETYRFIVTKRPGKTPDSTDCRYYVFDRGTGKWRHLATINNPNGGFAAVETLSGMNSFLENFSGKDKDVPRLATYRLWLGSNANDMKSLAVSSGDGPWGELNNAYFLGYGAPAKLNAVFAALEPKYGKAAFGGKGIHLPPIPDQPVPADVIATINNPPVAQPVRPGSSLTPAATNPRSL